MASNAMPQPSAPAQTAQLPNGAAVAALTAGTVGMLAMAVATIASQAAPAAKALMIKWGHILPVVGPTASGPYAGHETVMLFAGVGSWLLLHLLWSRRQFEGPGWLTANLAGITLATLLQWQPIYALLIGKH
jgi:hypothetical protein